MIYASRILRLSRKLTHTHHAVQKDHAILVRRFTHHARTSINNIDDIQRSSQLGLGPGDKHGNSRFPIRGHSPSRQSINQTTTSTVRMDEGNILRTARKGHSAAIRPVKKSEQRNFIRWFSTDSGLPTHQEIGMPSLSPTMTEGNVARWLKKEGEKLSPGDVLCEVETDKATVEMECMEEGYLAKIVVGDGSTGIKVGEIIAITVEEEEDVAKFKDYSSPSTSGAAASSKEPSPPTPPKEEIHEVVTSKPSEPSSAGDRIFTGPLTSLLAEDENVPLTNTRGTSPDGRSVKADIKDHRASSGKEVSPALDYTDIPQTQIRKVTASRLLESKQTIPHYYLTVDTCVDKLMEMRSYLNSLREASDGKRISVNDLVIKAAALALREVPQCNSWWTDDYIRQFHNVNINVAVQTDNGLCVPVIKDADKKGLSRIAEEVKHLAQKARENSLKPEDYEGGTFTVSNLGGPFGVDQFRAIVNPPQSGILAVGSAVKRMAPGSSPNQYEFASFMAATLSCDHRVVDGAIGAEWLKAFKGYIENPQSMLI